MQVVFVTALQDITIEAHKNYARHAYILVKHVWILLPAKVVHWLRIEFIIIRPSSVLAKMDTMTATVLAKSAPNVIILA
jgi:hypothetical protein